MSKEATESAAGTGQETQVAILMDNTVITAPTINGVMTGDAQISGGTLSTRDGTTALAATLNHGVLPLRLVIASIETVR
ncbi:SecDF P1 head subdomain-containing protein [Micromonospora sp. NPDC050397]|uniref:SecDF P1 head subdomain-containing protein n=1 Tax=Micromonospora sp. NPDC050397 TaxID=3364279 RepID=UPI00384FA4D7